MERFQNYVDDPRTYLLRRIVAELTEGGADMSNLPPMKSELVKWLEDKCRYEEATGVDTIDDFRLHGSQEGYIRIQILGDARDQMLIDFQRPDAYPLHKPDAAD